MADATSLADSVSQKLNVFRVHAGENLIMGISRLVATSSWLLGIEETTPLQFTPQKLRTTPYVTPKMEFPSVALLVVPPLIKEQTKPLQFSDEKTIFEFPLGQSEVVIPDIAQTQVQEVTQT